MSLRNGLNGFLKSAPLKILSFWRPLIVLLSSWINSILQCRIRQWWDLHICNLWRGTFNDCFTSERVAVATPVLGSSAAQRRRIGKGRERWGPNTGALYGVPWAQGPAGADQIPMQSSYYSHSHPNKVINPPIPLTLGVHCNFPNYWQVVGVSFFP